jgi:hypothetical protein
MFFMKRHHGSDFSARRVRNNRTVFAAALTRERAGSIFGSDI